MLIRTKIFGWIEFVGGILKLIVILFVFVTMIVINLGGLYITIDQAVPRLIIRMTGANNKPIYSKCKESTQHFCAPLTKLCFLSHKRWVSIQRGSGEQQTNGNSVRQFPEASISNDAHGVQARNR